jgi:hypothetical protein
MNTMSGFGESILCEIVAQVLFKSLKVARAILDDGRNFKDDQNRLQIRMKCQIALLEGVAKCSKVHVSHATYHSATNIHITTSFEK